MRSLLLIVATAASLLATGCTIQQRSPIREVAYDFSDYAYYDRPYAPSPEYQANHGAPIQRAHRGAVPAASGEAPRPEGRVAPASTEPRAAQVPAGNLCGSPAR